MIKASDTRTGPDAPVPLLANVAVAPARQFREDADGEEKIGGGVAADAAAVPRLARVHQTAQHRHHQLAFAPWWRTRANRRHRAVDAMA